MRHARLTLLLAALLLVSGVAAAISLSSQQPDRPSGPPADVTRSNLRERLLEEYDLSNPKIDLSKVEAPGVWTDGIPPLTSPDRTAASGADYPDPDGRVVALEINGEAVAYPIGILNWHEIVNDQVGGEPVAVTYCPLCDSAAVARRTVQVDEDETLTFEFGVSGLLYNSNVVMYDRTHRGLWSQVAMKALTGPLAGTELDYLPVRVVEFQQFQKDHPGGQVLTRDTGHRRAYDRNPYTDYFEDPDRVFHEFEYDDRLPAKALGLGVLAENNAYFVPADAVSERGGSYTLETPKGEVVIRATDAGMQVESAPAGVNTIQTFYHSWAAFHPKTRIRPGE